MRVIAFTDIDDTLMSTRRKTEFEVNLGVGAEHNNVPTSFCSSRQSKLWSILSNAADIVIPVTARSAKTFARVSLPFTHEAILDFGGSVYLGTGDGESRVLDKDWQLEMHFLSENLRQELVFDALMASVVGRFELTKTERRVEHGVHCFMNLRTQAGEPHKALTEYVSQWLQDQQVSNLFSMHMTDVNVTVLPKFINKADAVRYVMKKNGYEDDMTLGLGDSLTDLGFMAATDYMILPSGSQAAKGFAV